VIRLGEGVHHELPVHLPLVHPSLDVNVSLEAEVGQLLLGAVERLVDRERTTGRVVPHEDEAVALGHRQLDQTVCRLVDVVEAGFGTRERPQAAVERVRPRVIRAGDLPQAVTDRTAHQRRAAMTANVDERLDRPVGLPHDDDRYSSRRGGEVGTGRRDLARHTGQLRHAVEQHPNLRLEALG
jgi:hypothetical protein